MGLRALAIALSLELSLFYALWLMLPAYVANPSAQLTGGGLPIDFGRTMRDGERILGDGKTWRGLLGGVLGGVFVGGLQISAAAMVGQPYLVPTFSPDGGPAGPASFAVVLVLALGSLLGDSAKSFVKRRMRRERGAPLPIADQYDFVLGSWVLTLAFFPSWFASAFTLEVTVIVVLVTFFLHRGVSMLGYRLGLKAEPW